MPKTLVKNMMKIDITFRWLAAFPSRHRTSRAVSAAHEGMVIHRYSLCVCVCAWLLVVMMCGGGGMGVVGVFFFFLLCFGQDDGLISFRIVLKVDKLLIYFIFSYVIFIKLVVRSLFYLKRIRIN